MDISVQIRKIREQLPKEVTLVCVSKMHSAEDILQAYRAGERDFGESYVQELLHKHDILPKDIRWHFIGHLQTNKVKWVLPVVHLIQSVDSVHLLEVIQDCAYKMNMRANVLLEVHVAREETKTGFRIEDLTEVDVSRYPNVVIRGVMGMASNTDDAEEIRRCFRQLVSCARLFPDIRSFGMSGDYTIAVEEGSNMIRVGSAIFGQREMKF